MMQAFGVRRGVTAGVICVLLAWGGGAPAHATSAGSGVVSGNVVYGGGVPPLGAPCQPTSFSLQDSIGVGTLANETIRAYAGEVRIDGSGSAICETASHGLGTVTLLVNGTGRTDPQSTIHCGLSGTFIRVLTQASVIVSGPCWINGFATSSHVVFVADVTLTPTEPGAGVTGPVTSAKFTGTFHAAG